MKDVMEIYEEDGGMLYNDIERFDIIPLTMSILKKQFYIALMKQNIVLLINLRLTNQYGYNIAHGPTDTITRTHETTRTCYGMYECTQINKITYEEYNSVLDSKD